MPDPSVDSSWITTILGGAATGGGVIGAWKAIEAWFGARKAEARTERKEARAEAAEIDIITTLRKQLEAERQQRSDDVALLRKEIAECRKEISDLRGQLDEAFDARVEAMREATKLHEMNVQLETKINLQSMEIETHKGTIRAQQEKITSLSASYSELSAFVSGLELAAHEKEADAYVKASAWVLNGRAGLERVQAS